MAEQFLTQNKKQTENLAKMLAKACLPKLQRRQKILKHALIFGFVGNLGAGKTTFIQSFAKGLGIRSRLTSPTFVLMKKYNNLYHLDCYRIKDYKDILALDFAEIVADFKNIILIEWAEKIKKILPKNTVWIKFKILPNNKRKIEIS